MSKILEPLRPYMTTPDTVRCPDGYYRRAVFGIGPVILDYPEQVQFASVVQGWCPQCTAKPRNLDGPRFYRSREHTNLIALAHRLPLLLPCQ